MGLVVSGKDNSEYVLVPPGSHIGRIYQIVDLGVQKGGEYLGAVVADHVKIHIGLELPEEIMDSGKPMVISRSFKASFHKKANLRKFIQGMLGKTFPDNHLFDVNSLIGHACMINVVHVPRTDDPQKMRAVIESASPVPKGLVCKPPINPPVILDLDEFDPKAYAALPEWVQKKINRSGVLLPGVMATAEKAITLPKANPSATFDDLADL